MKAHSALAPSRPPTTTPAAHYVSVALALLVLATGAVAVRELAVEQGWLAGPLVVAAAIDFLDGLSFATWMIPLGVGLVIMGVLLVAAALTPRRATALRLAGQHPAWITRTDLARAATRAARLTPGVTGARSTCGRRTLTVAADVTNTEVAQAVEHAVAACVAALEAPPRIRVQVKGARR